MTNENQAIIMEDEDDDTPLATDDAAEDDTESKKKDTWADAEDEETDFAESTPRKKIKRKCILRKKKRKRSPSPTPRRRCSRSLSPPHRRNFHHRNNNRNRNHNRNNNQHRNPPLHRRIDGIEFTLQAIRDMIKCNGVVLNILRHQHPALNNAGWGPTPPAGAMSYPSSFSGSNNGGPGGNDYDYGM